MKRVILFISGLLVGCLIMVAVNEYTKEKCPAYVCSQYKSGFDRVDYEEETAVVDFHHDKEKYFFNVTLNLNTNVDYSDYSKNDAIFVSVSFDGLIPYSVLKTDQKYIQIPLQQSRPPEEFSFTISSDDNAFSGEDLDILNSYLNGELDQLTVSVNLFDPNGLIILVSNSFISD